MGLLYVTPAPFVNALFVAFTSVAYKSTIISNPP
jgi:hypothetical protein